MQEDLSKIHKDIFERSVSWPYFGIYTNDTNCVGGRRAAISSIKTMVNICGITQDLVNSGQETKSRA